MTSGGSSQGDASGIGPAIDAHGAGLSDSAFESLYHKEWRPVLNYLRFRIGHAEAQDLCGEVFMRAWARRSGFRGDEEKAAAWLWTIARNAAVDWHRHARSRPIAATPIEAATEPESAAARSMDLERVRRAARTLHARDREIIALRFGAGLTNRDVGALLGMTESNVGVRLHRALHRLRRALDSETTP